jgi:hypothetical protein
MRVFRNHPLFSRRAICAAGAALLLPWRANGQATRPTTAPAISPAKIATIRSHADALIARAVRSQVGWGWADEEPGIDLTRGRHPKGKIYAINASHTAGAGLLLDFAGKLCGDASYRAAAMEAGHAIASLQTRAGQIRGKGAMGVLTALREDANDLPDRSATRLGLALLLHLLDVAPVPDAPDARVKTAALRAAHWLGKQQTHAGGWPSLYPPDAKEQVQKILRLDTPDYRDTALAVLLASDVLGDRQLEAYFDRAIDLLLSLRISAGRPLRKVFWASVYRLDGDPNTKIIGLPAIPDLLASRRMLELLLGGQLLTLKAKYGAPLKEARDAIAALQRNETGDFYRRYDQALRPHQSVATQPAGTFSPVLSPEELGEPRTKALLARLDRMQEISVKQLRDELEANIPVRRRMVLMLAGFADDAIVSDPHASGATRSSALAGSGALAETLDTLWYELRMAQ